MSPPLATFILLSGNLISSSASSLARIKLSLENLSTIKSLAASPIGTTSLDTTALTGYIALASYSDTSCGTPFEVGFVALNTCFPASNSTYSSITATSRSYRVGKYSDSLCKTAISAWGGNLYGWFMWWREKVLRKRNKHIHFKRCNVWLKVNDFM